MNQKDKAREEISKAIQKLTAPLIRSVEYSTEGSLTDTERVLSVNNVSSLLDETFSMTWNMAAKTVKPKDKPYFKITMEDAKRLAEEVFGFGGHVFVAEEPRSITVDGFVQQSGWQGNMRLRLHTSHTRSTDTANNPPYELFKVGNLFHTEMQQPTMTVPFMKYAIWCRDNGYTIE